MDNKLINEEKYFNKEKKYKYNRKLEIAMFIVGIIFCLIAVIMIYIIKDYYIFLLVAGCGIVIDLIALAVLIINYNFSKQNEYMAIKHEEDKRLLDEIFNMNESQKFEIIKKLMLDEENK